MVNQARLTQMLQGLPKPFLQNYKNTTKVMTIKGQPIYVEDIAKAALISRSNLLLLGSGGWAKTTLMRDVLNGSFNGAREDGKGIFMRAHPKMDEKEFFTHLNLGKYFRGEVESSKELRETLESIRRNLLACDEITRAPPFTQNRILAFADGEVEIDGVPHKIGNGYCVLIAAGNEGDEYFGTFQLDRALVDRFPAIIDLDNFIPQAGDTFMMKLKRHDPRVPEAGAADHSPLLKEIHTDVSQLEASIIMGLTAQYLVSGLGDCSKRGVHKLTIKNSLEHGGCEGCGKLAEGCGFHLGISERWSQALIGFTLALQQISIAKNAAARTEAAQNRGGPPAGLVNDDVIDILEVFKTFAGHTGIVIKAHIMREFSGNPYLFMCKLAAKVKQDMDSKMDPLLQIIRAVEQGGAVSDAMLKPFTEGTSAGASAPRLQNPWRFIRQLVGV